MIFDARRRIWYPNFSPNGRTVLFTKETTGGPELWTVPTSGGDDSLLLRLTMPHTNAAFGAYSRDGTIAFRQTQYDGVDVTHMTEGTVRLADPDGSHRRPAADGGWMSQIDPRRSVAVVVSRRHPDRVRAAVRSRHRGR
jgi:Tol biopolymer transport system component